MSTIITKKQFNNHIYKTEIAGRPFSLEFGKVAELANASAMVRYGDTSVLVAVTAAPRPRDGVDFFPLSVDFEEKLYAVGRIPGSFMRREGQPSLPAVLASRVIDRSIRPLFPGDFRNDVVVTCTVMSVDRDCSPEAAAMVGVSACLAVSNIPWGGPIGCLEVGYVDGQIVMNPNQAQKHASKLDLTVAATGAKVVMIEAGADQLPDEIMYEAIVKAHEEIKAWRVIPRWISTWKRSPINSRRRLSKPGSSRGTGWMAVRRTRSVPWPLRWACCPGSTARPSSPGGRPRSCPWQP